MAGTRDIVDLVLEYGPEGNVHTGNNCSVYNVEDEFYKFIDNFYPENIHEYKKNLESAGVSFPETNSWREEIPVYGIGETTVIKQEEVDRLLETRENIDNYCSQIREMGLRAAAHDLKLDLSLCNLAKINGEIGVLDINDHEAVWTNEELALHLMGSHLKNSVEKYEKEYGLYAPKIKQLGEKWKGAV